MEMLDFYKGKRVFITGHTGFKGSWLCTMLLLAGAEVTGYALPPAEPGLFQIIGLEHRMRSVQGDIRDLDFLWRTFEAAKPELVFHLAAQPIVRESYRDPVGTYSTNVMGTVHILECIRRSDCVRSFLNVTTDKVYENHQWPWGYRETDVLNGFDPYSNSKSCSELVTDSYKNSFFLGGRVAISTARAGNVIGGGGFLRRPYHSRLCSCGAGRCSNPDTQPGFSAALSACVGAPVRLSAYCTETVGKPEFVGKLQRRARQQRLCNSSGIGRHVLPVLGSTSPMGSHRGKRAA